MTHVKKYFLLFEQTLPLYEFRAYDRSVDSLLSKLKSERWSAVPRCYDAFHRKDRGNKKKAEIHGTVAGCLHQSKKKKKKQAPASETRPRNSTPNSSGSIISNLLGSLISLQYCIKVNVRREILLSTRPELLIPRLP